MKALVSGGTGFIGSHLIDYLISRNISVRALVRKTSNLRFLNKCAELYYGDLGCRESLKGICEGVDIVFNMAGQLSRWGAADEDFWKVNVEGVHYLLDEAAGSGVKKFIHASTTHIMGFAKDRTESQDYPEMQNDPYEVSKRKGEKLALGYAKTHDFDVTVVRPDFVYGPRDPALITLIQGIKSGVFHIVGSGNSLLHPTYISDLIEGVRLASEHKDSAGKIYNIAGPKAITVNDLAKIIAETLGVKLPRVKIPLPLAKLAAVFSEFVENALKKEMKLNRRRLRFLIADHTTDISKSVRELGFNPQVNFREGIEKTIVWYRDNSYL